MYLTCPECKNDIDLSRKTDLKAGDIIECEFCGITLEVSNIDNGQVSVEIVDEGK